MTYDGEPTIRLRRVGIELRRIRESANLTIHEAGRLLDRSPSSMSKVENGQVKLWKRELERILDRYGVTDPALRDRLATLNENGRKKGWWLEYREIGNAAFLEYVSLEAESRSINTYEPNLIPGLLQTEEYARAVIGSAPFQNKESQTDQYVTLRMGRQRLLTGGDPPHLHAIIGEAALRQLVGGRGVMIDQLALLVELAGLDFLTLQVLPFAAGVHPALDGPFILLDVDRSLRLVYAPHSLGAVYSDLEHEIERCTVVFDWLGSAALSSAESIDFIERVIGEM